MKHTASIDTYFNQLDPNQRAELERIRDIVLAVAPEALEKISYGMVRRLFGLPHVIAGYRRAYSGGGKAGRYRKKPCSRWQTVANFF